MELIIFSKGVRDFKKAAEGEEEEMSSRLK